VIVCNSILTIWCKGRENHQADCEILCLRANKSGTTQNCLPWQRPLSNQKNWPDQENSCKYLQFGEKIVKIGSVDTETALLIVKKEEINTSKIYSAVGRFAERAKKFSKSLEENFQLHSS